MGGRGDRDVGSDGWGPRGERPLAAVAFDQVVRTVEPEVPAGWFVVAGGEVDGLGNGAEQMLGAAAARWRGPAPGMLGAPPGRARPRTGPQVGSGRCQAIPDLPPPRLAVDSNDPGVLKLAQALAERLGGDPARRSIRSVNLLAPASRSRITSRLQRPPTRSKRARSGRSGRRCGRSLPRLHNTS